MKINDFRGIRALAVVKDNYHKMICSFLIRVCVNIITAHMCAEIVCMSPYYLALHM